MSNNRFIDICGIQLHPGSVFVCGNKLDTKLLWGYVKRIMDDGFDQQLLIVDIDDNTNTEMMWDHDHVLTSVRHVPYAEVPKKQEELLKKAMKVGRT